MKNSYLRYQAPDKCSLEFVILRTFSRDKTCRLGMAEPLFVTNDGTNTIWIHMDHSLKDLRSKMLFSLHDDPKWYFSLKSLMNFCFVSPENGSVSESGPHPGGAVCQKIAHREIIHDKMFLTRYSNCVIHNWEIVTISFTEIVAWQHTEGFRWRLN